MSSVTTNYTNSSGTSSQVDTGNDAETTKVKNYVKDLLRSRIFLGRYLERRLCTESVGYRDIVLLSPAEVELKKDFIEAQNILRSIYSETHWIGITDGHNIGYPGILLWTEIENQPFGPMWFQIKSIKFREDEVIPLVKCIRHISDAFLEVEPLLTGAVIKKKSIITSPRESGSSATEALNDTYNEIVETLKGALSIRNVKEFITFLCAFVIAVFTGSTAFINFLGNFVLALIRETSFLIKNSTPLFLGFLDFLSKIVGGFYILLAMFFRPSNPAATNTRSIRYANKNRRNTTSTYDYEPYGTNFD